MKTKKEIKEKHKPLLSEFSMGLLDFNRLDEVLRRVTMLFMVVREYPYEVLPLLDALKEFYRILRPLMGTKSVKEFDDAFKELQSQAIKEINIMRDAENYGMGTARLKSSLYASIDGLADKLYLERQKRGIGIPARRERDKGQALSDAFGVPRHG